MPSADADAVSRKVQWHRHPIVNGDVTTVTTMKLKPMTIEQLQADTASLIRQAGASPHPVPVTDHGREVAIITNRSHLRPQKRSRIILPEFEALMAKDSANLASDIETGLGDDRGSR
jgi:antitoxin (DNA-binding transcriptional repressor) of toxin-antitoxin stability system